MPKCKLCGNGYAIKNSHIVSKFLWRLSGVTGHHKKFDSVCLSHDDLTERHRQDGFKEVLNIVPMRLARPTMSLHVHHIGTQPRQRQPLPPPSGPTGIELWLFFQCLSDLLSQRSLAAITIASHHLVIKGHFFPIWFGSHSISARTIRSTATASGFSWSFA